MSYLIYAPDTPDQKIYLLNPGVNTIGRDINNTIVIPNKSLSRHHAEIVCKPEITLIKDLKSLNKTFVNNVVIEDEHLLQDGDSICLAQKLSFKYVTESQTNNGSDFEPEVTFIKQFVPENNSNLLENLAPVQPKLLGSILKLENNDLQERAVEKLKILLEISKQLCTPEEPEKLFNNILEVLFKIMAIDRAAILLVNSENKLETKAIKSSNNLEQNPSFYSKKIVNWVRNNGTGLISTDARLDGRLTGSFSIMQQKIHASMCVPLKPQKDIIGVIYVDNLSISSAYSEEDLDFLIALANQASVIIHLSQEFYRKEQELKQQVIELQIQIDEARREKEVEEIVNADFFKNLQQKAKNIRPQQ